MNRNLLQSQNEFKERLRNAPIIKKQKIAPSLSSDTSKNVLPTVLKPNAGRLIFEIISILKDTGNALTANDLQNRVAGFGDHPELPQFLQKNPRIEYDPVAKTFRYKPDHAIRNKDDLLKVLKETKDAGEVGMDYKELKDSWSEIGPAVEDLEKKSLIYVFRGKDEQPKFLYHNDVELNLKISDDFRSMWSEIPTVTGLDLQKELDKAGLKGMEVISSKPKAVAGGTGKRKRARARGGKMTNVHLADFSITPLE
ncbi:hypothetical protein BJ742DRAFT_795060 [Cladochytrium replicatum]|nr:hypothetical protein BJ742DRAFT_795060 [Cladochytrium replicatum]